MSVHVHSERLAPGRFLRQFARTSNDLTVLFLDISGFTDLTGLVAELGTPGIDVLRSAISRFFAPAIAAVLRFDGDLVRYEGDAITAIIPGGPDRASLCASQILETLRQQPPIETTTGPRTLRCSIGLASGPVRYTTLDLGSHTTMLVGGAAVNAAVEAQRRAEMWSAETAAVTTTDSTSTTPPPQIEPWELCDPVVVERLDLDAGAVDQFRTVATLFARLGGGRSVVSPGTAALLESVVVAVADAGGSISMVGDTDKGGLIMVTFGAPVAAGDPSARAARLAEALHQLDADLAVGISTGTVFAGIIGSEIRATYSVVGVSVNRAARLMMLADAGQTMIDSASIPPEFAGGTASEVLLKGEPHPVGVVDLASVADHPVIGPSAIPLVDRQEPRALITRLWDKVQTGVGVTLTVIGSAGIGKSKLVNTCIQDLGAMFYGGAPVRYRANRPFEGIGPVIAGMLDLDPEQVHRRPDIERALTALGLAWGPDRIDFVGMLLGVDGPRRESDDPATTTELIHAVALDLIRIRASHHPFVIQIDDMEAADKATIDLVSHLSRTLATTPVLMILSSRAPIEDISGASLALDELEANDAAELATILRGADGADLASWAGGNPLMLTLGALRHDSDDLPMTLEAMATQRLDALPASTAIWLRKASVFGEAIRLDVASTILGDAPTNDLLKAGLVRQLQGASGPSLAFAHGVLQEAAYEAIPPSDRGPLHHSVGVALEHHDPNAIEELAHHFRHTDDQVRQTTYFKASGERAAAAFALDDAVMWFGLLLPILDAEERPAAALQMARWQMVTGDLDGAEQAIVVARDGESHWAEATALLGHLRLVQGAGHEGEQLLDEAKQASRTSGNVAAEAEILRSRSILTLGDRRIEEIESNATRLLELAPTLGVDHAMAAHNALGSAYAIYGVDMDKALHHLTIALELASEHGNLLRSAILENDLAGVAFRCGDLPGAVTHLDAASTLAFQIGARRTEAMTFANGARLRMTLGDHDGALACAQHGLLAAHASGSAPEMLFNVAHWAIHEASHGDGTIAMSALANVIKAADATGQPMFAIGAAHTLAKQALPDDPTRARDLNGRAQSTSQEAGINLFATEIAALDVQIAHALSDDKLRRDAESRLDAIASDRSVAAHAHANWLCNPSQETERAAIHAWQIIHNAEPTLESGERLTTLTGTDHSTDPPELPPIDPPETDSLEVWTARLLERVNTKR